MRPVLTHRVRYHETDAQGFVFNARYLEWADVAFTEYLRDLGFAYPGVVELGIDPSVVSAQLRFRRPGRFDDVLEVAAGCTRVGTSSFDVAFEVRRGDEVVAEVASVYVNVEAASATSRPLPADFAEALRADVPA